MSYGTIPPKPEGEGGSDERTWAMFCHLSTFAGYVIPFGNVLGPLIIWLIKKDQYALVDDQGKEAINFQISVLLYFFISAVLCLVIVGFLMLIAVAVFDLVMTVIATIRANAGERYRYPMTIRFVS